jgi:hypothetical protein
MTGGAQWEKGKGAAIVKDDALYLNLPFEFLKLYFFFDKSMPP